MQVRIQEHQNELEPLESEGDLSFIPNEEPLSMASEIEDLEARLAELRSVVEQLRKNDDTFAMLFDMGRYIHLKNTSKKQLKALQEISSESVEALSDVDHPDLKLELKQLTDQFIQLTEDFQAEWDVDRWDAYQSLSGLPSASSSATKHIPNFTNINDPDGVESHVTEIENDIFKLQDIALSMSKNFRADPSTTSSTPDDKTVTVPEENVRDTMRADLTRKNYIEAQSKMMCQNIHKEKLERRSCARGLRAYLCFPS
eukprot:GILK01007801.1.p1 GENE.GILK01007801.1~~GILK01007801.1.p1  ORF type:complete len:257 (-),score=42.82 GILK01007801.1:395-1165(-)